jgi:hypothetical protein
VAQDVAEFPKRGGANGSLRFYDEVQHGANAGAFPPSVCRIEEVLAWFALGNWPLNTYAHVTYGFAGLDTALDLLKAIGDKYDISYADLFQLASARAVEVQSHAKGIRNFFPATNLDVCLQCDHVFLP